MEASSILNVVVYLVILVAVPVLSKAVIAFLDVKKQQIQSEGNDDKFEMTKLHAIELVQNVVDSVSQTYVDDLKKEGKFTPENQKEALNKAIKTAKDMMDSKMQEILSGVYSDLDSWIAIQVESYIKSGKIKI